MTNITISEYGHIYKQDKQPSNLKNNYVHTEVSELHFKELYNYWKNNDNAKKVLEYDGYTLKATSYVGIIQTKNLSIEILPKIYNNEQNINTIRNIFISMLKPLLGIKQIQTNKANLSTATNNNIYEIFISMFVNELQVLISKGLKSQYINKEENKYFLKGKLKFKEHIKQNYVHKERFYVSFDEYLPNTSENKILKSCINLLLKTTKNNQNKKHLRRQLFVFDEVKYSSNYDSDISKINIYRGMEYYTLPLMFAKVFLKHKSFSSLRGKNNVFALLFPMEKVFEKYMEFVLNNSKDILGIKQVIPNGNKGDYFLHGVDDGMYNKCKMTNLEPDYLLEMKRQQYIVCDAKWKLLWEQEKEENKNKNCENIIISSDDVYQIFAYLSFYNCSNTAYLLVPKVGNMGSVIFKYQTYSNNNLDKKLKIIPIDLNYLMMNNHKWNEKISI